MNQWERKESWTKRGNNCLVEIKHWTRPEIKSSTLFYPEKHCWNIYVYVYPEHWLFSMFKPGENEWEQPDPFELHGGATYFRTNRNEKGEINSFCIGCDYAHCDDDRFEAMATLEDAWEVMADAENAFRIANGNGNHEPE